MLFIQISQQVKTIIRIIILLAKYTVDTDYSTLTEEIEANPKARKCNAGDRVRLTKYKNSFSLSYTKIKSREILI